MSTVPIYRVSITGKNLELEIDGERGRFTFKVTRFVEAENAEDAGARALEMVRTSPKVQKGALNSATDPVAFRVTDVDQVPQSRVPDVQPGFAFHPQDPEAE